MVISYTASMIMNMTLILEFKSCLAKRWLESEPIQQNEADHLPGIYLTYHDFNHFIRHSRNLRGRQGVVAKCVESEVGAMGLCAKSSTRLLLKCTNETTRRLILNYKGLAYRTEWMEFPEIETLCKKLGVGPGGIQKDGTPFYTLPVIHDEKTGRSVSDSMPIARYLDEAYPDTPRVMPASTFALQVATEFALQQAFMSAVLPVIVVPNLKQLNTYSREFYRNARETDLGKLEDLAPTAASADETWKSVQDGLSKVAKWMGSAPNDQERSFFMGDAPTFADFVIAARLVWMKRVLGHDSERWKQLMSWDDKRWERFMEKIEKYEIVY